MDPDNERLDELVMTCLDRVEHEGSAAIDALCDAFPADAEDLRKRLAALADAGLLGEPDAPPERLGEFRLGRRLGGGGMGVVYAAVQEPLERDVALKVVRADQLYFPGSRERFRRELRIIASLAHAHIVPVYSGGECDGVPYFAMERLHGATLAEVLAVLDHPARHGSEFARAIERVVEQRDGAHVEVTGRLYDTEGFVTCLTIAQRVASALDHAHERGVLHRDVKPSNVMLTVDGRVLVFDFGLASSADAPRVTQSSSRVGSLAYMSPEQVRGEQLDERSDVYGAGALLFEALTLRPPHVGNLEAISASILAGKTATVRAMRPGLPRDVETVVQTALAHRREDRYASAAGLARDLRNILERRPIEARPARAWTRALRWIQRHPARAALLVLLVVGPTVFAVQQQLAARRIEAEHVRAESNLDRLLASVDTLVWRLGQDFLAHAPGKHDDRIALLRAAHATLESMREQRPGDVSLEGQWARIHGALGEVEGTTGTHEAAEHHFLEALAASEVGRLDPRDAIGLRNDYGNLLMTMGRTSEATDVFLDAVARARVGGEPLYDAEAVSLRNASRAFVRSGRREDARAAADPACEVAERHFATTAGGDPDGDARLGLAAALVWRARVVGFGEQLKLVGTPIALADPVAAESFERGLALAMSLVTENPNRSDAALEAAAACSLAPKFLSASASEDVLRRGLALIDDLAAAFPERVFYSQVRVGLLSELAMSLSQRGDESAAHERFRQAADEAERWCARHPNRLDVLETSARALTNLAVSLVQLDRRAEACEPASRAARAAAAVLEVVPELDDMAHALRWAQIQEAYGRLALGEFSEALALAEAIPASALDDALIAVSSGELFAGCAELARDDATRAELQGRAVDRLAQGLALGFGALDYVRQAREWASLRGNVRFEQIISRP